MVFCVETLVFCVGFSWGNREDEDDPEDGSKCESFEGFV